MIFGFVILISAVVLGILAVLRFTKGIAPLRNYEKVSLPGLPGPTGLIHRLDGSDQKQRPISYGRHPELKGDNELVLPKAWETDMTAGRYAAVAHLWALDQLKQEDPNGAKERKNALFRAIIIPFFSALILIALVGLKRIPVTPGIAVFLAIWAFCSFSAFPGQFREWKAAEIAKKGLQNAGLWPQLSTDANAVDICLKALYWCRVAGFRRILPR